MAGAFDKCIAEMKAAAGKIDGQEVLSDKQAAKVLKALLEERKNQKSTGLNDPDLEFLDKVEKMIAADKTAAIIEKRNAVLNLLRKNEFMEQASKYPDDYQALQAFLVGTNKPIEGGRSSVASRQQAMFNQYAKGLLNDLEKEGLDPYFRDPKNGRDIAVELFELDIEGGNPGRTGNTAAVKIAKIVKKYQADVVARQNKAGAWIQKIPGYIVSQSHDMDRIAKATYEDWRNFILPKLDLEKTFGLTSPDKWDEMLLESYKSITSGRHMTTQGSLEADGLVGFKGPGSLGRKVSEHRVFHFSSPENFVEYNDKFGSSSVQEAIIKGIGRASNNIALMEKMGPNPQAFYNTVKGLLLDRNKTNLDISKKIEGKYKTLDASPDHLMAELTGETSMVKSISIARFSQGVRQWTNMVSLGGSIFSQLPDLAAKASDIRFQGDHPFNGYRQAFMDVFVGKGTKDQQRLAKSLGAGFEGILHENIGRFFVDDQKPGVMTSAMRMFFKLNGMEYWNDAQKMGYARYLSSFLANHSDLPFGELHPRTQNALQLYGIKDAEWEALKLAKYTSEDGHDYIMPELIENEALRTQFQEYMADRIDTGVLTPGVRERAIITRGTQAGTWEGEGLRFIGQFKMFSISAITKLLPRELEGSGKPDIAGLVQLMTGATVLGYFALAAKDIVKGKQPRSMEDPRTWKAALLQGGGLGIYGDFLFGEYDRYGGGLTSAILGPSLGKADPIGRMYSQAVAGKLDGADVFQFAKNNTPFLNLFYLRTALDYLFLYDIQESLNPGFLRRMEKRIMDDSGQEFILPPSQTVGS